jgi:hypothetical protein
MPMTGTRRPARASQGVSHVLSALERLVDQQVKHARIITKQEQHLAELREKREIQLLLDPKYTQFQDSRERKREINQQWHSEILEWDPLANWFPNDDRSLYEVFLGDPLWTTWQYQSAYPVTAKFLAKATYSEKSRSLVYYDSFFQSGEVVEQWNSERASAQETEKKGPMPEKMWDMVRRRIVVDKPDESGRTRERLPSRLLRIMDISPVVAAILLASTPKCVTLQACQHEERSIA